VTHQGAAPESKSDVAIALFASLTLSENDVTDCCVHAGWLVVISIGVALGVAIGVFLLFALIACHKRYDL